MATSFAMQHELNTTFLCTNNSTPITQTPSIKISLFWPEQLQGRSAISRYFVLNTHGSLPPLPQKVMVDKFWSVKRTHSECACMCHSQHCIYETYSSVPDVNFHKNSSNRSRDAGETYNVCMLRMLNQRLIVTKLIM
jgi:hypothetical protein